MWSYTSNYHCPSDHAAWQDSCALTFGEGRNYCIRKEVRKFKPICFFPSFFCVSLCVTAKSRGDWEAHKRGERDVQAFILNAELGRGAAGGV